MPAAVIDLTSKCNPLRKEFANHKRSRSLFWKKISALVSRIGNGNSYNLKIKL
jgi:hypothetical protein